MTINLNQIKQDLQKRLSQNRYSHTESVVNTALEYAQILKDKDYSNELTDEYIHKIEIAAWLHDCCKELANDELLTLAEFYKIEIYDEDKDAPNILHARVGAAWSEDEYDIYDPVILQAIKEHTLGAENMLLSSKILYLADMLEPTRDNRANQDYITTLNTTRTIIADGDLDQALLNAMNSKIEYVIKKGHPVHPISVKARNAIIKALSPEPGAQSS